MPKWVKPGIAVALLVYLVIQILSFRAHEKPEPALAERVVMTLAAPLQNLAWSSVRGVINIWQDYIALIDVSRLNRKLYVERDELARRLVGMSALEAENVRLRALLGLKEKGPLKLLFGFRVASGPTPYERTMRILRGKKDGVRPEMAVLNPAGVVGQVVEVSDRACDVLLLTDLNSAVDGVIVRSRARGIVRGLGTDELNFEYVTKGDDIRAGDQVVTTGLDGIYPKEEVIGTITRLERSSKGLFTSARIKPSADFSRVEDVAIVLGGGAE